MVVLLGRVWWIGSGRLGMVDWVWWIGSLKVSQNTLPRSLVELLFGELPPLPLLEQLVVRVVSNGGNNGTTLLVAQSWARLVRRSHRRRRWWRPCSLQKTHRRRRRRLLRPPRRHRARPRRRALQSLEPARPVAPIGDRVGPCARQDAQSMLRLGPLPPPETRRGIYGTNVGRPQKRKPFGQPRVLFTQYFC